MDEATLKRAMRAAISESCDAIAEKVITKLAKDPPPFWIAGERHYNDHKRIGRWFRNFDMASKVIVVLVVTSAAIGLLWLAAMGVGVRYQ